MVACKLLDNSSPGAGLLRPGGKTSTYSYPYPYSYSYPYSYTYSYSYANAYTHSYTATLHPDHLGHPTMEWNR